MAGSLPMLFDPVEQRAWNAALSEAVRVIEQLESVQTAVRYSESYGRLVEEIKQAIRALTQERAYDELV